MTRYSDKFSMQKFSFTVSHSQLMNTQYAVSNNTTVNRMNQIRILVPVVSITNDKNIIINFSCLFDESVYYIFLLF